MSHTLELLHCVRTEVPFNCKTWKGVIGDAGDNVTLPTSLFILFPCCLTSRRFKHIAGNEFFYIVRSGDIKGGMTHDKYFQLLFGK